MGAGWSSVNIFDSCDNLREFGDDYYNYCRKKYSYDYYSYCRKKYGDNYCRKKYATELQLQEEVAPPPHSSTVASNNNNNTAAATTASGHGHGKGKCADASSSRPPVAVAATLVFCKICMDMVPQSDAHRASHGCAHAFCGGCLSAYVGAKIQDRIADVRCPEEHCGGVLAPELCQDLLPREVFERWGTALCESMMLGAKKIYCPFKDCSEMMLVDDGGDVIAESKCPSCRRLFCAQCNVAPWHAGVTCAEYKFFVEKREGCLHITCRCGFEFCYACGKKWRITHPCCTTA